MDEQQRRAKLKETFDAASAGYDGGALRFFPASAQHMVSLLDVCGDEHVLDVACGTGHASLAAALAGASPAAEPAGEHGRGALQRP